MQFHLCKLFRDRCMNWLDSAWEMPVGASCLSSCRAIRRRSPCLSAPPPIPVWKGNALGKQSVRGSRHMVTCSKGDQSAIDRRALLLMQGHLNACAWKAKVAWLHIQGTQ